jgi:hypothetical protein
MRCRHCSTALDLTMADLGTAPPSNAYLTADDLQRPETWYPLRVLVCRRCWLAQTADILDADELFTPDYAYFSSVSTTWVSHAQRYVEAMAERFGLQGDDLVVEVAANDGYLLQFVQRRGLPCLGIEPTASTAAAARDRGIETIEEFFGVTLATQLREDGRAAKLLVANNVLAHVPDINDFVAGFAVLLRDDGVATFEFPHLLRLLDDGLFDTIYHEHFSYLSLGVVQRIFTEQGLTVFDVEELPTHGGSLRVFARRRDTGADSVSSRVTTLLDREEAAGLNGPEAYTTLQPRAQDVKSELVRFLLDASRDGRCVVGYGAAAKGNTLLNFAGVRADLLPCVVDLSPAKQGTFLPGSRIPVVGEDTIDRLQPDYVLILPWNLREEIADQLGRIRSWGGSFVTALPRLSVW